MISRRIVRIAGLGVGLGLGTAWVTLVATAWAQVEATDTTPPRTKAKAKAAGKGLKGKRKGAGATPVVEGLAAILFNPTEEEAKALPVQAPPAAAEPGATAATEPAGGTTGTATEPTTAAAGAQTGATTGETGTTTPTGTTETGTTGTGTSETGTTTTGTGATETGTATTGAGTAGTPPLGPLTPPRAAEPAIKLVNGDEDFPFLSSRSSELVLSTEEVLAKVEPLTIPPIDPDLLQFGFSWSLTGGTGTRPGREADVARCGIYGKPGQAAKQDAGTGTPDPACIEQNCSSSPDGGICGGADPAGCATCLERANAICAPTSSSSTPGTAGTSQEVCCTFDAERGTWDCGQPNSFPNRTSTYRDESGVEMQILCLEPAPAPTCAAGTILVGNQCQASSAAEGSPTDSRLPLTAGAGYAVGNLSSASAPLCCSVPSKNVGSVLSKYGSGYLMGELFGSDCHPAAVALGTGVGGSGKSYSATTEIYGEGTLKWFAERKQDAYNIDLAGRLSLISELYSTDPDRYTLRARLQSLKGAYRRYLVDDATPVYVLGGLDLTDALLQVAHTSGQATTTTKVLPGHATVGVGYGRLYSVEPRIRLKKLESMLLTHGVIREPLSADVARQIMLAWWALRSELGYDQRLLHTFRILKEAGQLEGPITAAVAYRFGQIMNDPQFVSRRQGSDSLLSARVGTLYRDGATGDPTFVFELQDERVFNLSTDNELYWAPRLGVAPRKADWYDNRLFGAELPFSGLARGLAVAHLPVGYRHFIYDNYLNKMGAMDLSVRAGIGYANDATVAGSPDGFAFSLGVGGKVSWYQSASQGWSFYVDGDAGMLDKKLVYAAVAGVRVELGNMEAYYVAPGDLGDALPFDLPIPELVAGPRPAAAAGKEEEQ